MAGSNNSHTPRQTNAYVCLFVTFGAATVAVVCRLLARRVTRLRLASDDYLALVAFLFATVWSGLALWCKFVKIESRQWVDEARAANWSRTISSRNQTAVWPSTDQIPPHPLSHRTLLCPVVGFCEAFHLSLLLADVQNLQNQDSHSGSRSLCDYLVGYSCMLNILQISFPSRWCTWLDVYGNLSLCAGTQILVSWGSRSL